MAPASPIAGDPSSTALTAPVPLANFNRWPDSIKVYTRKIHNKTPKPPPAPSPPLVVDVTSPPPPPPPPPPADVTSDEVIVVEGGAKLLKIDLRSKSKSEIRQLRLQLTEELEQIRAVSRRFDSEFGGATAATADITDTVPAAPAAGYAQSQHSEFNGFRHLTVDTNCITTNESFEREKRTPKANQYYFKNPDFLLIGRDKFPPLESNSHKKLKPSSLLERKYSQAFKGCASLLSRLMKHKFGWVFNAPVDVKGLGLYDYYSIIKHPMDLGTVKSRLNKNWYKSPGEFAEDVRLTFRNAMIYNPKGQDVHVMAEQLLQVFEERWVSIEADYSYVPCTPTPMSRKNALGDGRMLERSDSTVYPMGVMERKAQVARSSVLKQPKPKAKDLYKRNMTFEEKQKLGYNLQNLPPEKLDGVVQIIRRRNSLLCQQDDEIEVDIDCVDTETLWELDRFVTNYKKSLSKHKRKAELALLAKAEAERRRGQEMVMEVDVVGEPNRENRTVVCEKEVGSTIPVEGENRTENASGSSSSSSSSSDSGSSSSDSDSDSSSAYGSDAGH